MGVVYEVEHVHTGERLALKVVASTVEPSPQAIARFKREARVSVLIKSENVVRVTDADVAPELDGAPFLVMELLEGMDFEKAAQVSPPSPATAVGWLRQVARAMDKAHHLGIVHRDLKPENLFLARVEDRAPVVKVLDFGIAKMAQEGRTTTDSGRVLGTPKYMAPEQASANSKVTAAADLYALGLVAYRLLMGEPYYRDDNLMGILGLLLHGELELPSPAASRLRRRIRRLVCQSLRATSGGSVPIGVDPDAGARRGARTPTRANRGPSRLQSQAGGPDLASGGCPGRCRPGSCGVGGPTPTAPDHPEAPLTQRTPARTATPLEPPPPIPAAPAGAPATPPSPRAKSKARHSRYPVGASDRPDEGKTPAIQPPESFSGSK